ncbi:MAG: DNA polymerase III subunit gamma/tau [Bacteroidales bacterium]|jgi:DNA polymerase-3 subunit gamma/tau|nr:DNA polymerase III subunit gamma/tau [Bacteroidales bacterium]
MENFCVSARKYRPSTFKTIVGQSAITTTLKNAVRQNQVAQAFLFCGPRGVGKTTCARILAKTINCLNLTEEGEACNQCESCISFNQSASFNFFELDAASNNSVDDIRTLVEQVRILPQGATYKVYIIDEVHMLSAQAFNAFLKTLEEPPPYAKFILATTEKHKIIPTILSRCQIFDFKRIKTNDIVSHLEYVAKQEKVLFEQAALEIIGQKAEGSLRDALSIFDQAVNFSEGNITYEHIIDNFNIIDFNYFFKIIKALHEGDIAEVLIDFNDIIDKGYDGQIFLESISEHIRNLMACKLGVTSLLETGENIKHQYIEQAKQLDSNFMLNCLSIFSRCDATYKTANNKRLHIEISLMLICNEKTKLQTNTTTNEAPTSYKQNAQPIQKPKQIDSNPELSVQSSPTFKRQIKTESSGMSTIPIKDILENEKGNTQKTNSKIEPPENPIKKEEINYADEPEDNEENIVEECRCETKDAIELLTKNWVKYVEKATPNAIAARMLLNEEVPLIKDENKLMFEVANSIAEKEIKDNINNLLQIIYAETNVKYSYEIHIDHNKKIESKIIDPDEKFKKMNESNPSLLTFKQQLNLNIF